MNRRELFRFLPSIVLALPGAVVAAEPPQEPSPWVEMDCTYVIRPRMHGIDQPAFRCDTHFKFLRGTTPICPRCGMAMCVEEKSKRVGIEVK